MLDADDWHFAIAYRGESSREYLVEYLDRICDLDQVDLLCIRTQNNPQAGARGLVCNLASSQMARRHGRDAGTEKSFFLIHESDPTFTIMVAFEAVCFDHKDIVADLSTVNSF